uniref:Uncharacterized protein n=1 Tax=Glyptapanteles indiensis TaxID=92994 RepID=A0JCV8_GLYIN|nr:hypothetical protein GIP_L1_00290 [Glyptapanteles indiensis]
MKLYKNSLLVAAFEILWLQNVSAGLVPKINPAGDLKIDDPFPDIDSILRFYGTLNNKTNSEKTGANISWGSQDVQSDNDYSKDDGGETLYGSRDIQIGNIYPENPDGTNVYGAIVVQKNNVYHGTGKNVLYGASVTQIGNVYPENSGEKDIYAPVVIQEGNIYPENSGDSAVFGAIVNQINNTYPKSVEANKDALKPIIYQSGNVYPPTSQTNSVVGAVVKEEGSRFHPSQGHHERPIAGMTIDMVIRQYKEIKRIIDHHLRTDQPTSKRCTDGMMDLKKLDQIESLYLTVGTLPAQLKALQEINRNRKIICDSIGNQCSKHADMQKWIASSKQIVMKSTERSIERWESLQKC